MKNYNIKIVVVLTLSTLMMNGCLPRHKVKRVSPQRVVILPSIPIETVPIEREKLQQPQKSWKRFKPLITKRENMSKTDCIDCYATPIVYSKPPLVSKRTFSRVIKKPLKVSDNRGKVFNYSAPIDYSKAPSSKINSFNRIKHYGSYAYREKISDKIVPTEYYVEENLKSNFVPSYSGMNSSYSTFSNSSGLSIQVGAFREYEGAKRYERRYRALSSKYRTTIKTGIKNSQPIYRVQIEGFKSDMEAKRFMNNYAIQGAFLVRR